MSQRRKKSPSNSSAEKSGNSGNLGSRVLKGVLIGGSLLLVLLFIGLFALKSWIENYRNSAAFRDWLTGKIAASLLSDVELAAMKWDGSSVYADGFRASGYEDAALARLEIDGLRATFGGVEEGAWQVPEATANRMSLEFSPDRRPGDFSDRNGAVPIGPGTGSGGGISAWLKPYLPTEFAIDVVKIDSASLSVAGSAGAETFALRSVRTELRPTSGGGWEIGGRDGRMFVTGQPNFDIQRFKVRWQGEDLYLNEAEIDVYDDARLSGKGVIGLAGGTSLDLDVAVSNLDVKHLLGPGWENKITGSLRGDIKLTGSPGDPEGLKQSGTLHLEEGLLTGLPLLDKVAEYTKSVRFQRLALNEATGDFKRRGDRLEITSLVVQSDGLCRLEGTLSITGRNIRGDFRLGVTPGTLRWIPGAERKVFTTSEDGFLWTKVQLAGTLDEPSEDLTKRLMIAAGEALVEEAPQKAIDTAKEIIKNPTAAPASLIDQGKSILNTLTPLLK